VGFANLAIANNTVSIVITGPIAKEINDEYSLSPKTAAILDIFPVLFRVLPYGPKFYSFKFARLDFFMSMLWYHLFYFLFTMVAI
jgi:Na+/H+ antiporter NhaC